MIALRARRQAYRIAQDVMHPPLNPPPSRPAEPPVPNDYPPLEVIEIDERVPPRKTHPFVCFVAGVVWTLLVVWLCHLYFASHQY